RHHAGRIQREVGGALVLAGGEIHRAQLVRDPELQQQPVDQHAGGARRVIEDRHPAKRYHRTETAPTPGETECSALPCSPACWPSCRRRPPSPTPSPMPRSRPPATCPPSP